MEAQFLYKLRPGLHWCRCSDRVIFLDLAADRYFSLSRRLEASFLCFASGGLAADLEQLQPLVRRGILLGGGGEVAERPVPVPAPTGDFGAGTEPRSRGVDVLAAIGAQLWWRALLRVRRLEAIAAGIDQGTREPRSPQPHADEYIARIVRGFAASSLLLPAADRCLVRALAFHHLCRRKRIYPRLVFGVRINPFRAHCWVQLDGTVLLGDYEQVRLFTPILALG